MPATHLLVLLLCLAVVFVVYGDVFGHRFLSNWDDNLYVTDNGAIRGFSVVHLRQIFTGFYVGNYAPLQMLSYMVDYSLWGLRPGGFLLTNLLLHGLNGYLLYRLVYRLDGRFFAALGGALLFLLHPVQVESVAWISQRKNLLSLTFFLMAFFAYLSYRQGGQWRRGYYLLAVVGCGAALLTKSVAVIFPTMLILYDVCYCRQTLLRSLPDKIPFFVLVAATAYLTLLTQSVAYGGGGRTSFHGGSAYTTLLTMLPVFVSYLRLVFWPSGLSAAYAPAIKTAPDLAVAGAALVLALAAGFAVYRYRRDRRSFFWLSLVPLGLLPVAQIFPLITLMNDRYLYYPLVGMAPFLSLGVAQLLQERSLQLRRLAMLLVAVALAALAVAAYQRTKVWHDAITLWRDTVAKTPASPMAKFLLAEAYFRSGRYVDAKPLLLEVIAEQPERGAPYELLGNICYMTGETDSAARAYLKALSLAPDSATANHCLGNIYLAQHRAELARERLLKAAQVQPESGDILYSLACAESLLNRPAAALAYLTTAFRNGFTGCTAVAKNPELDPLRGSGEFAVLMTTYCGEGRP